MVKVSLLHKQMAHFIPLQGLWKWFFPFFRLGRFVEFELGRLLWQKLWSFVLDGLHREWSWGIPSSCDWIARWRVVAPGQLGQGFVLLLCDRNQHVSQRAHVISSETVFENVSSFVCFEKKRANSLQLSQGLVLNCRVEWPSILQSESIVGKAFCSNVRQVSRRTAHATHFKLVQVLFFSIAAAIAFPASGSSLLLDNCTFHVRIQKMLCKTCKTHSNETRCVFTSIASGMALPPSGPRFLCASL